MPLSRRARLVTLALVLVLAACAQPAPPREKPPAAPEPLSPRGPSAPPIVFRWNAVPGQPIYRVRVTDAAERVLFENDTRATECRPSDDLSEMLGDHATFSWRVGVVSSDGSSEVAWSAAIRFSEK